MKLDKMRELTEAATPPPWLDDPVNDQVFVDYDNNFEGNHVICDVRGMGVGNVNLRFIAAARTLMPKLIKVAEAAKALAEINGPFTIGPDAPKGEWYSLADALHELEKE